MTASTAATTIFAAPVKTFTAEDAEDAESSVFSFVAICATGETPVVP